MAEIEPGAGDMPISPAGLRHLTKPGRYADGGGLYLQVRDAAHRSWLYRWKVAGKTHWMGLGSVRDVGLAEAREAARDARKLVRSGGDPIGARRERKADAEMARRRTFRDVAEGYVKAHEASWRNAKHRAQWRATLAQHVYPILGDKPVAAIDVAIVMDVLEPLWRVTPETASRVRGRIEAVLDHASARGWRTGDNPARWRGHLQRLLPARAKVRRTQHHPALPWRQVCAFMAELREQPGDAAMALQFAILTATRSGEVRGMRWAEIDFDEAVWTVPADRMKAGREHRVPLSKPAKAILAAMAKMRRGDLVFPGRKVDRPLSDMALLAVIRRMNNAGEAPRWVDRGGEPVVSHGFRSTFRDWTAESTSYPRELAEAALAHTLADKVEAAYQRGDLLAKRRGMMDAWAAYCAAPARATGGKVVVPAERRQPDTETTRLA